MFQNLNVKPDLPLEDKDTFGGYLLDSDIYKAKIVQAYGIVSKGGAKGLTVKFEVVREDNSTVEYTNTFWVTNRKGEITYVSKTGKEGYMPGFTSANTLCNAAINKNLTELGTEVRVFELYDYELKKNVPSEVNAFTDLMGEYVGLALLKVVENKNVALPDGTYAPSDTKVEKNIIDKIFVIPDLLKSNFLTVTEFKENAVPEFATKWLLKNKGAVVNKFVPVSNSSVQESVQLDIV